MSLRVGKKNGSSGCKRQTNHHLSTFDDTHKFTLMAHICTQIICPVTNGKLKLEDLCVFALMRDSLTVMSLKEIELNMDSGC
ncbi:hypothetical protein V3C99_017237, partial [Haemonchus contortus]